MTGRSSWGLGVKSMHSTWYSKKRLLVPRRLLRLEAGLAEGYRLLSCEKRLGPFNEHSIRWCQHYDISATAMVGEVGAVSVDMVETLLEPSVTLIRQLFAIIRAMMRAISRAGQVLQPCHEYLSCRRCSWASIHVHKNDNDSSTWQFFTPAGLHR